CRGHRYTGERRRRRIPHGANSVGGIGNCRTGRRGRTCAALLRSGPRRPSVRRTRDRGPPDHLPRRRPTRDEDLARGADVSGPATPAAFIDRDGTIIRDASYVRDPNDVALLPGAAAAIRRLNERGIPVIVVTNQSGIARGYLTTADYELVRARLDALL